VVVTDLDDARGQAVVDNIGSAGGQRHNLGLADHPVG
jgi:hypothetical protein